MACALSAVQHALLFHAFAESAIEDSNFVRAHQSSCFRHVDKAPEVAQHKAPAAVQPGVHRPIPTYLPRHGSTGQYASALTTY